MKASKKISILRNLKFKLYRSALRTIYITYIRSILTPSYLTSLVPLTRNESTGRVLRNHANISTPSDRLTTYNNSFFPSTISAWNALPAAVRTPPNISSIKHHNHTTTPITYISKSNLRASIIYCQMRYSCSPLNDHLFRRHIFTDPTCPCSLAPETTCHFFLHCPYSDCESESWIFEL